MTGLRFGGRFPKDSPWHQAMGDLDELEALLGLARLYSRKKRTREELLHLQRRIFAVNAQIAGGGANPEVPGEGEEMLEDLEARLQALEKMVELPRGFVLAGGNLASAHLDLARSVARRCERRVVSLHRKKKLENRLLLAWMNRLSDFLYLLARYEGGPATLVSGMKTKKEPGHGLPQPGS